MMEIPIGADTGPSDKSALDASHDSEVGHEADPSIPLVPKPWSMRTIYSDMPPREVRTRHTVASLFLGEGSTAEHILFEIGVRNQTATGVIWCLWYIGAIMGLAVIGRYIPESCVWASLLMLPLPVVTILLVSVDLLREVCSSMDLYIIYILQFAFFVDGIYYCDADLRRVFWYCYLPTMVASGLVDAYPAKFRTFFAKLFFSNAIAILAVFNAFLVFRWKAFGDITKLSSISFTLHHISDQLTLFVFYCRHVWCSAYYPDHFVMIKAEVVTGRAQHSGASPKAHSSNESQARHARDAMMHEACRDA